MKFSCERCQTRYSIGDEKVRGKVLKIRCKTCGNILVVREPGAVTDAQAQAVPQQQAQSVAAGATGPLPPTPAVTRSQAQPPRAQQPRAQQQQQQQQPAGDVDWYVAIKGKQHGPAKRDDVVRLYREGKITERTYLWNEAMTAWTRLRELPQFAFLLAEPQPTAPQKRAPPPPPPSEEGHSQQGAEIIPFDEAKRAREGATGVPMNDPFAAVSNAALGGDQAPRDSTRVFIMQAGLQNRAQKQRMYAYVAVAALGVLGVVCVLDYNEIVKIPGLHNAIAVVAQKHDSSSVKNGALDGAAWDTGDEDPKLKCQLMPNREECEKKVIAANLERRKHRASPSSSSSGGVNLEGAFNTGGGVESGNNVTGGGAPAAGGGLASAMSDADRAKLALLTGDAKKAAAVKLSAPEARNLGGVDGGNLDQANVAAVVKANQPAIQDCIEKAAKNGNAPHGKKSFVLSIEPNGRVSNARFNDGATQASEGGECISKAAKKWKFAPFPGPTTDVEIPLVLSLN